MSIKVRVRMSNDRSKEKSIKRILKDRRNRKIEKIELEENGSLLITFSDSIFRVRNIVKQYSKAKYKDRNSAIRKFLKKKSGFWDSAKWKIIKVIELPDEWLVFYMKN